MVMEPVAEQELAKHHEFLVALMQVAAHSTSTQPRQEQLTSEVAAVEVTTTEPIAPPVQGVQEHASLSIGVKNGTLCKN
jgi:hypothetical protein